MTNDEVLKLAKECGSVNYRAYRINDKVDHIAMYEDQLLAFAHAIEKKARDEQQWSPIETAPKTGRVLLLGYFNSHGNWRTMRGEWYSKERINEEFEDPDLATEGWYETPVEADDFPNCWQTNPTHWMPLPAAPNAIRANKE